MMVNDGESVKAHYNRNCCCIPDEPYRNVIISGPGSGKTIVLLLNLAKHQRPDFGKDYLKVKVPLESKFQLRVNGREKVGIKLDKNSQGYLLIFTQKSQKLFVHKEVMISIKI